MREFFLLVLLAVLHLPPVFWAVSQKREKRTRQQAAPKEGRFVRTADAEIFIQEIGPDGGPVVLFTHGMTAWGGLWRPLLTPLTDAGLHCVLIDMPPFGYSERPKSGDYGREAQAKRLWGVADALGARKVFLVGHSMGGPPAAEAALMAPDRVHGLVLIAPTLGFGGPLPVERPFVKRMLSSPIPGQFTVATVLANPLLTRKGLAYFMSYKSAATLERVDILRKPLEVEGTVAEWARWLPGFLVDKPTGLSAQAEAFARFKPPTMLIWGDEDKVTPLAQGRSLSALMPKARFEVLPRVGHMPQLEMTEKVQMLLVEHLKTPKN